MPSVKSNKEQNKLIELTAEQQNPFLARPEQFEVGEPNAPAEMEVPGHGQCGDTKKEYQKLLKETPLTGTGQKPLPTAPDDAAEPHTK